MEGGRRRIRRQGAGADARLDRRFHARRQAAAARRRRGAWVSQSAHAALGGAGAALRRRAAHARDRDAGLQFGRRPSLAHFSHCRGRRVASPRRCFHRARVRDPQCARARHHRFRARDPTRPRRSPAVAPVRRAPSPRDRPSGPRPGDRCASIPSRRRRHAPRAAAPLPLAPPRIERGGAPRVIAPADALLRARARRPSTRPDAHTNRLPPRLRR